MNSNTSITAESLVRRLRDALLTNGDFPVSARIVSEINELCVNPNVTADQLSAVVLKDPTLGARLLSLVNSTYYMRSQPILTVSQAIVHIGLTQLAEMCANLILLQCFVPAARQGAGFSKCLRKAIVSSVLTELLSIELCKRSATLASHQRKETGYLVGFFSEMGAMLLAYYYPSIYQGAVDRAESRSISVNKSLRQLIGVTSEQISVEISRALELPAFYIEVLSLLNELRNDAFVLETIQEEKAIAVKSAFIAERIAGLLYPERRKRDLDKAAVEACKYIGVESNILGPVLQALPSSFEEYCNALELVFPPLPSFLESYSEDFDLSLSASAVSEEVCEEVVTEIKELIDEGESAVSLITAVVEAIAWKLDFDRVVLLLCDHGTEQLNGHLGLGQLRDVPIKQLVRDFGDHSTIEVAAVKDRKVLFQGDPLFEDGWPMVALPVGVTSEPFGVIYADKVGSTDDELSFAQKALFSTLTELLDQTLVIRGRSPTE